MTRYTAGMTSQQLDFTAFIQTPGRLLDKCTIIYCSCGYERNCGYMDVTAERLASQHEERYGHTVITQSEPATPLTVQMIKKKLQNRRGPERKIVDLTLPDD